MTGRRLISVLLSGFLIGACGGGRDTVESAGAKPESGIGADQLVVVTGDARVLVLDEAGALVRELGVLPLDEGARVNAVDVAPDGSRALISALTSDDDDATCSARVYEVDDAGIRGLFDGGVAAFSADGRRIAHVTYANNDDQFCLRARLVIRDAADGAVLSDSPLPGGRTLEGTPPDWPMTWAPDGAALVYLGGREGPVGAVPALVEVRPDGTLGRYTTPPGGRFFSPAFLADGDLLAADDCCISQHLARRDLDTGEQRVLGRLDSPIRSIRADRGGPGAWLVTEIGTLARFDGEELIPVPTSERVLMASG